MYLLIFLYFTR